MRSSILIACVALFGCDSSGSDTCALSAQTAGAVTWQSQGNPACIAAFSGSMGSLMAFRLLDSEMVGFTVDVKNVMGGQTGSFPAQVEVEHQDHRKWETADMACTVTYDLNSFVSTDQFGKSYQTSGRGECATPALPLGTATGMITVAPFTFRFEAHYF